MEREVEKGKKPVRRESKKEWGRIDREWESQRREKEEEIKGKEVKEWEGI